MRAIFAASIAAYGWVRGGRPETDLTDEQILERLLKLNRARNALVEAGKHG